MSINRNALKTYAPKARREFNAAITARAATFGITKGDPAPAKEQGEVVIIAGAAYPKRVGEQRRKLLERIRLHGFEQTMEEVSYTWFNRFLAIRFMELHGYLDHGYRALSHPDGRSQPEILEQAEHLDFPGLNKSKVVDLKLDGTKDAELYRMLLIAQCNALHRAMPFLFERIDDETELLLPDNLLHTDSLIRKLVTSIDEADWREIEIIGWLYQFYISEKKDQVMGKVVKSEDIPAATQLFTPNWIVKYMVQNSLGAQWLATYPDSSLKVQMDYYIEPAEQTEEVQRQLAEITPKELNPEELTLMDPACGSGHILVEAYDLFKAIYLERGYRLRDIPRLILEKNLYGLDIDDRAAQMAGFALLMRARADDRRILSKPLRLNVREVVASDGLEASELAQHLLPKGRFELLPGEDFSPETLVQPTLAMPEKSVVQEGTIEGLIDLFADAKTFGSLITIPDAIVRALPALTALVQPEKGDDLYRREAKTALAPLVAQTTILARKYDNVVANPPYMGGGSMNGKLKKFARNTFPDSKSDLFAMFMERALETSVGYGMMAMINMQSWMFLSSFEKLRTKLLGNATLLSMAHLGERGFDTIGGAVVSTTAFVFANARHPYHKGDYLRLVDGGNEAEKAEMAREAIRNPDCGWFYRASAEDFSKIPGSPIAYWASHELRETFAKSKQLRDFASPRKGMVTADNPRFIRQWFEVEGAKFARGLQSREAAKASGAKWFPYLKGGPFKRWYGNVEYVVNWENDGAELLNMKGNGYKVGSTNHNLEYIFKPALSWTKITTGLVSFRSTGHGFLFDDASGLCPIHDPSMQTQFAALLNSPVVYSTLGALNPTLNVNPGNLADIPVSLPAGTSTVAEKCIATARADWDAYETSWDFSTLPLLSPDHRAETLEATYTSLRTHWQSMTDEMKALDEENNRIFIDAYGLQDELTPEVPLQEITLTCNPAYRYRGTDDLEGKLRADTMKELISYAMGCMMGRYSLAEPGLIYAHAGNEGFDASRYGDFPADEDGIVPITDMEWFDDDATRRFEEFIKLVWPQNTLRENLAFIADALKKNGASDPLATIRNYLSRQFYKNHLKTYKKRPIYWLFSSGKQRAFECLVYLHRYNEGTLSRMRMEYVTPLQSRMAARIEQLSDDIAAASSSADRTRRQKEKDKLVKQLIELRKFDEELRHYADQRVTLDLDDGVKVNYGKFGRLLAERKAITGEK